LARIEAGLEKKRLRDQEAQFIQRLQSEREKSERLLLNVLPKPIADRLKQGETAIADSFSEVTVMFADVVGFTEYSTRVSPAELVSLLNEIFSGFDGLVDRFGLEKIKSIGDEYMVVSGISIVRKDHAETIVGMALEMLDQIAEFNRTHGTAIHIRIGIHTGPVVAGIIGRNKFAYDLWGETVNIAHRMQTRGVAGKIQLSEATRFRLPDNYPLESVRIHVKGKGEMQTYLLSRRA
jgi:class 3 adenylate cyclase